IIAVSSHSSRQLYLNKRNIMAEPLICPLCKSIMGNSIDGIAIYGCGHMICGECFYDLHHQSYKCFVCKIWSSDIFFH
ncbi:unnamed protein product, partial [Rotaria sp. Silwood1]